LSTFIANLAKPANLAADLSPNAKVTQRPLTFVARAL
jgi:hypothetical protein